MKNILPPNSFPSKFLELDLTGKFRSFSHQVIHYLLQDIHTLIGIYVRSPPAPSAVGPELFLPKARHCLRHPGSSGATPGPAELPRVQRSHPGSSGATPGPAQTGGRPASPRGKAAARATAAGTHGGRRQRGNISEKYIF